MRPDFFKKVMFHAQTIGMDFSKIDLGFKSVLKNFEGIAQLKKHLSTIKSTFTNRLEGKTFKCIPEEPWATIIHGDFWVNNILFHKNEEGRSDNVKFVDFQLYWYSSPLKDLPYFLCGSLSEDTMFNHFDDLLNVYYDSFIKTLKRMNCNTAVYTRESFETELKKQAIMEFPLIALASKFFLFELDEDKKETADHNVSNVFESECSESFINKLISLVNIFEKREWF